MGGIPSPTILLVLLAFVSLASSQIFLQTSGLVSPDTLTTHSPQYEPFFSSYGSDSLPAGIPSSLHDSLIGDIKYPFPSIKFEFGVNESCLVSGYAAFNIHQRNELSSFIEQGYTRKWSIGDVEAMSVKSDGSIMRGIPLGFTLDLTSYTTPTSSQIKKQIEVAEGDITRFHYLYNHFGFEIYHLNSKIVSVKVHLLSLEHEDYPTDTKCSLSVSPKLIGHTSDITPVNAVLNEGVWNTYDITWIDMTRLEGVVVPEEIVDVTHVPIFDSNHYMRWSLIAFCVILGISLVILRPMFSPSVYFKVSSLSIATSIPPFSLSLDNTRSVGLKADLLMSLTYGGLQIFIATILYLAIESFGFADMTTEYTSSFLAVWIISGPLTTIVLSRTPLLSSLISQRVRRLSKLFPLVIYVLYLFGPNFVFWATGSSRSLSFVLIVKLFLVLESSSILCNLTSLIVSKNEGDAGQSSSSTHVSGNSPNGNVMSWQYAVLMFLIIIVGFLFIVATLQSTILSVLWNSHPVSPSTPAVLTNGWSMTSVSIVATFMMMVLSSVCSLTIVLCAGGNSNQNRVVKKQCDEQTWGLWQLAFSAGGFWVLFLWINSLVQFQQNFGSAAISLTNPIFAHYISVTLLVCLAFFAAFGAVGVVVASAFLSMFSGVRDRDS